MAAEMRSESLMGHWEAFGFHAERDGKPEGVRRGAT